MNTRKIGSSSTRRIRSALRPGLAGFTMIELVIVIVLVSLLAVFAAPKMVDTQMWRLKAFGDQLQSQSQAMLRQSMVQRRPIVAAFSGSGVSFAFASEPETVIARVSCPSSASPCLAEDVLLASSGDSNNSRSITFNSSNSGASLSSTGEALAVTVSHGDYSQAYQIENETGLFHRSP